MGMAEITKTIHPNDPFWLSYRSLMMLDPGSINLNTGSFGPTPQLVFNEAQENRRQLAAQPMDFFLRLLPPRLHQARLRLAHFLNSPFASTVFFPNVTLALNGVINSLPLILGQPNRQMDLSQVEVLMGDLEYGSLVWAWQKLARATGLRLKVIPLPRTPKDPGEILDTFQKAWTPATRVLYFSHVTSPTGMVLPARELCQLAKSQGAISIVDGAHAPAFVPLNLEAIGADFYAANCHKWLLAPIGSGFLCASPDLLEKLDPLWVSWGYIPDSRLGLHETDALGSTPAIRRLEFAGTMDPAPYLGVGAAIELHQNIGPALIRQRQADLNRILRDTVADVVGWKLQTPEIGEMSGGMVSYQLPNPFPKNPGPSLPLRNFLWENHRLEVNLIERENEPLMIRFSTHFYTTPSEIGVLREALPALESFIKSKGQA
jgi:isopenicillin-N epimerase